MVALEIVDQPGVAPGGAQQRASVFVEVVAVRQHPGDASGGEEVHPSEPARDGDGARYGGGHLSQRVEHLPELLDGVGGDHDLATAARGERGRCPVGQGLADPGLGMDAEGGPGPVVDEALDRLRDRVLRLPRRGGDRAQQRPTVHGASSGTAAERSNAARRTG